MSRTTSQTTLETLTLDTERMIGQVDEAGIGWILFNHPERHNALSLDMWQGIADILQHFSSDDRVRVAVMRGVGGKAFVSGADISEFDKKRADARQKDDYGKVAGRANRALATFEKPMLALIEGYCIGGGLATALAADVRFASPDSKLGIPAARLGLGYDYEGLAALARLVGPSHARDIMFSARFLDAAEARHIGLVNFVVDREVIEAEVRGYAEKIAGNAPLTIRAAKAAINAWEHGGDAQAITAARTLVNACFDSDDYREGRRAFAEKRSPEFRGR